MKRAGFAALAWVIVGLVVGSPGVALTADICNAVALVDVPAQEDTSSILHKGEIDDAVSEYLVDKKSGAGVFCSHGGYCYPRYLMISGQSVEALRLTNCKIGAREPDGPGVDDDNITYDVDVDRSKNSAATLQEDDIDNALLNIGMCSACAGNASYTYINDPQSTCSATVGNALAGDKRAIGELVNNSETICPYPQTNAAATTGNTILPSPAAANSATPTETPSFPKPINPLEVGLAIAAILYFVPSVVGFLRRKRNAPAIFALNLFLGWTFLGWVGALVWSLLGDPIIRPVQ